jgi:hypothetical protein
VPKKETNLASASLDLRKKSAAYAKNEIAMAKRETATKAKENFLANKE